MTFASAIHDPLAINIRRQTRQLLSYIPTGAQYHEALNNASTNQELLTTLSGLLAVPQFTQLVATLFRPILLDLCARWIESEQAIEEHLIALCYLLEVHEELFPILNKMLLNHYQNGPLAFINGTLSPLSFDVTRLQRLLLAYYRILQSNRQLPHHLLWSLEPLSKLIWTPFLDNGVRLLAIRCYSLQSGMGEEERCKLERETLGKPCGVDCQLNYGRDITGVEREVDGWIMPIVELKRVQEERNRIITEKVDYFSDDDSENTISLEESDLSPLIANVHGVLLLRSSSSSSVDSSFISLPSSIDALRQLALSISCRLPTLLTSAPSAGKALLLSHLSRLLHPENENENQIVTIHLADTSLDPRGLLGSYVSSTVRPGSFEWKEGVLVRSMREGRWIVFDDIDRGSNEVLGVIKPLVESMRLGKWIGGRAQLNVPSRGTVIAHDNFMLFATRSVPLPRTGTFHAPAFFGAHKFSEVIVNSPSLEELRTIVAVKFPRLSGSAGQAAVDLWESVLKFGSQSSGRDVGIRELLKFCQRIDKLLPSSYQPMDADSNAASSQTFADIFPNPSEREDIYLEARDVFFGTGAMTASSRVHSKAVAQLIGDKLGLDSDRQQWVLTSKMPEVDTETDANGRTVALRLGRTRIPARSFNSDFTAAPARPFAMHKPAVLLLSRIVNAVAHGEPVLLTGETGTGKTSVISHLAGLLNRPLISLNLSHQTESSDLIGGLKPIDTRIPGSALQEKFLALFGATFSRRKNEKFEAEIRKSVSECKWKRAVGLWKESVRLAMERIQARQVEEERSVRPEVLDDGIPRKRRKTERTESKVSEYEWSTFLAEVEDFEIQHVHGKGKFAFGFVEGPLIKALRSGAWVLLDEVNLASPETLESLAVLLHSPTASITLTEHGSLEPIPRHPDFRLFACMNPATDVGKKDLPPPIRSRFTEIDVPPPDADKETLLSIISQYIAHIAVGDKRIIMDIAEFYSAVKQVAASRQIADGANHRPHFSMRTLVRALTFAADTASAYSLRRSVWEGCLMAFTMVLDSTSADVVTGLARKHLLSGVRNPRSLLTKDPSPPVQGRHVKFGPFYLEQGPLNDCVAEDYIMTPSVEQKLIDLARVILTRRFPVLIEGPTSSGKTSSIEYLAKRTGHRFVRINNHEHTDIQEYLGSYVSDPLTGKLVFKDGLLVQALRFGHWIVLDELNLAPTDVLEALNRLLDDNRELVIPETQEVVRPHPHFMLFATQNPPGLYAGRKVLSRAFRNRFLEVHFEDVPQAELETILCQRCQIAPSYGKKIVAVFRELQKRRQTGRVFESKQGFATLRDLFRWAGRDAIGYQELADNGYMLLAERTRREEDRLVVKEVIETVMGVRIDEDAMYDLERPDLDIHSFLGRPVPITSTTVWTKAMRRLYTLVCRGLKFNEPILLVGETGSGKTSVCQVFAESLSQRLLALNCHQNTETADIIGGLRPVRNRSAIQAEIIKEASLTLQKIGFAGNTPTTIEAMGSMLSSVLKAHSHIDADTRMQLEDIRSRMLRLHSIFEWHDGPLIEAMNNGDVFLLDEISLADDSVLERLNSVLEPGRSIVLAERGGTDSEQPAIRASEEFKLIATMNPGGDYGKKELSPALRNRFTEIWVPPMEDRKDLELIVDSLWRDKSLRPYTSPLLDFVEWLCVQVGDRSLMSLRDILAWVTFTNSAYKPEDLNGILPNELFHHAAHMTYLDGLSSLPQLSGFSRDAIDRLKKDSSGKLQELVPLAEPMGSTIPVYDSATHVQLGSFAIDRGNGVSSRQLFNFAAPTTLDNAMRVVRACQVTKPILLEGSPGVGKTSLITALANLSGHALCRINLSDQTDLIDLFGSDLPVEGGAAGEFAWKDAEFLRALQEGHWVLLDEMNLAPQAVLEGLNAILDHRGTVYIPELNRTFKRHPSFRIFAAQNPLHQGGGRKGLPKSFVNRFTKVYIEELTPDDLHTVCSHIFPDIEESVLRAMISFNIQLNHRVSVQRAFAQDGSPWEFNLRDVIRWGTLCVSPTSNQDPQSYLRSVYLQRFRNLQDRRLASALFDKVFCTSTKDLESPPPWMISSAVLQFGSFTIPRRNLAPLTRPGRVLKMQLSALESLGHCISQSWLAILTGPKNSGKTEIIRTLATFIGTPLWEVSVNSATDTMDILGSFEQVDTRKHMLAILDEITALLNIKLRSIAGSKIFTAFWIRAHSMRNACEKASTYNILDLAQQVSTFLSELAASETTSNSHYQDLQSSLTRLAISSSTAGQFEWVDGPLVKAMRSGQWLLLDGANLCGPSVLDRLNSLCESNGSLTLNERGFVDGSVQVIVPHPNFRLFMTVDPHHGELSRAMRNRGIEIAVSPTPLADDVQILQDHYRLPSSLAPSSRGPSVQFITFDAARRGLLEHQYSQSHNHYSTGRYLDQDSALSTLVDQAAGLLHSSMPIADELPWIPVFYRTLVPAYVPYFVRYIASQPSQDVGLLPKFVMEFPPEFVNTALEIPRKEYALQKRSSLESVSYQPMYFYWNDGPILQDGFETNTSLSHSTVLESLNLSSALFICEHDGSFELSDEKHPLKEKDQHVRQAVIDLYGEAIRVSLSVLSSSSTISASNLVSLKLASTLLQCCVFLKKAITSSTPDFSVLQAICSWLLKTLENCPSVFMQLLQLIKSLHSAISLSTGLGLFAIWSTLYVDELPIGLRETMKRTDLQSLSLPDSPNTSAIRLQTLNVLSMETLPSSLLQHRKDPSLSDVRESLDKCLTSNALERRSTEGPLLVDPRFIILELDFLACLTRRDLKLSNDIMREIVSLTCHSKDASLLRIIPYQHLLWSLEVEIDLFSFSLLARAQKSWLEDLWNTQPGTSKISGPAVLFHPISLHNAIVTCDMNRVNLATLAQHESVLRQQAQLATVQSQQTTTRMMQLTTMLYQSLAIIASSFSSSFDPPVYMAIQDTVNGIAQFPQSFETLISLLMCSTNSAFLSAITKEILPLQAIMAGRTPLQVMGLAWTGISRLLLDLVIPDTPVDPAVVHSSDYNRMKREESDLSIQIALHQQLEALLTGNEDNDFIRYLMQRLLHIRTDLATSPIVPNRSDVARLHLFWSEVLQFQASVLSPSKIDGLINAIVRGDEDADLREQVTQKSLEGFCQRLDTVYCEFVDISSLLKLAVLYMRFGLRILAESTTMSRTKSPSAEMIMTLLSFPSVNSADRLIDNFHEVAPSGTAAFRHVLLALGALSLEKAIGLQNDYRKQSIHIAYEQAMGLWLIDQAKEKQHQEEESTLYRKVDYNVATDAEIEEEEFLAMFPTFEDALENLANEVTSIHSQRTRPSLLVQTEDMTTLLRIHYDLTGLPLNLITQSASDIFAEMRSKVIKDLLIESPESLPETLDEVGIPFQFNILQDNILALDTKQSPTMPSYNFYSDPNYSELKKAAVIVDALRRRLHAISQEWPDQMVVQHLIERCDTILNIGSKIPIAKAIAMLEQLLVQSEDWQMYSNRENSIKVHQEEIVRLMVDWRRLELACWQSLLDSQAKTFTGELAEWWFRLYDAVIRGSLSAVEEAASGGSQNLDQYLASLIPLLDDFITSSPLGQFESRMQLIQSFERYLDFIAPSRPTSHASALQRVARVLNASHRYYDLFTDPLRKRLTDEKSLLEKEIKNFIKLASWKDINVQALKQSAQRTHRQLYKIMRKFRDVLRQPISGQLQPFLAGDPENRPLSFDQISDATMDLSFPLIPAVSSTEGLDIPQHLVNIEKTFEKYMSLIKKRVQPFISSYSAQSVDEAAVEIITTSKALASLTVPSGESTERREKYRKSLLVRKRKAWADLLKELKHAGLASSLKPEILRQNTNQQWLREQLPLPGGPFYDIEVKKGDTYFVKLCGCMPSLRSSLPAHHPDLTTRELQRGYMFLESGFAMAVDLRSRFISALIEYQRMQAILARLRVLQSSEKIVIPGSNVLAHVDSIKELLCKISHAFSELEHDANILKQLDPNSSAAFVFFDENSSLIRMVNTLITQLNPLSKDLHASGLLYLTQGENELLVQAEKSLSQIIATLSEWNKSHPSLNHLLLPLRTWLEKQKIIPLVPFNNQSTPVSSTIDHLLNSLLFSVQCLVARCPEALNAEETEDSEKYIMKGYQFVRDFTHYLNLKNINAQLRQSLFGLSHVDFREGIQKMSPFLDLFLTLARNQLAMHNNWMKSIFKLDYVLCSLLQNLTQQGFCQPQDSGEPEAGEDASNEIGGVGIGEGSGKDNVSKDIEDESQVEGLKGEEAENQEPEGKHEGGDAIEMNDDFGGALEDVDEPASDNETKSEGDDEPEFDETLGELDDLDPSAVDEKMWGDEKGPEDQGKAEEKADQDHSKEQDGTSEVTAKESKEQKQTKDPVKDDIKEADNQDVDTEDHEESQMEDGENDDANDPNVNGSKMDDFVKDAETLNLPDEMDLGGDDEMENEGEKEDMADSDDGIGDGDEAPMEDALEDNVEDFKMNEPNLDASTPDAVEENLPNEAEQNAAESNEENTQGVEKDELEVPPEEVIAQPDLSKESGMTDPNEVSIPEAGESASTGEAGTSQGGTGEAAATEEKIANNDGPMEVTESSQLEPTESTSKGSASSGIQQGRAPSQTDIRPVPNPLRSLGDALKEIRQRFDEILNAADDAPIEQPREQLGESNAQSQVEYLQPQDADHNMQALGPAGEEQVAKLDQLTILDDEMTGDDAPMPMDVDMPLAPETHEEHPRQSDEQREGASGVEHRADVEGAILQSGLGQTERSGEVLGDSEFIRKDNMEEEDQNVELQLKEWRASDYPEAGAERVWRLYESLTHDLAYTLCEQLRLILEPTMATRLKGDYRTGKRLNMKKVISYIASDYTKDKIWLRRTKPSQREYQVLISIDDSRSMAESHSVHLAYQTLALISKALSRLEAGDVAIAKFGQTVDLLHGFDEGPFSDQAGTKVINAFRFSQKATNVLSLLETSLKVLEQARERKAMSSASAADLWQLQIIISDGMCQDHEKLRTVLRKAEEQRVMIVFIILDTLQAASTEPGAVGGTNQGSILNMDKAEFQMVDGKMELQLQKYLDSFPFEYYVILRKVEALPEVLAGTLKQFFERISEE